MGQKWVDEVIEKCQGQAKHHYPYDYRWSQHRPHGNINYDHMVRITCAYTKLIDDDGVMGVYETVFHPDIDGYGKHGLLDYNHGKYPFVVFSRENLSRRILDTRGCPEIGKGWQDEIKIQVDTRIDRTALATCPPREYPIGRPPVNWGAGSNLPVRRRGEYGFVEIPRFDQGSIEVEQNITKRMKEYFGRNVGDNPEHASAQQQKAVNQWLHGWKEALEMVWDLYIQYGNDMEYFKVIGAGEEDVQAMAKNDVADKYDFYLTFDALVLNQENYIQRLNAVGTMMAQFDRSGSGDYDEFLRIITEAIDPVLSDRLILPKQKATQREIEQTQSDMAKISAGISVNPPQNANVELRMQVVQQYVQGTEEMPATDVQERLQTDEAFAVRLQNYQKQLAFQAQQRENAQIGRTGAVQGNGVPTSE